MGMKGHGSDTPFRNSKAFTLDNVSPYLQWHLVKLKDPFVEHSKIFEYVSGCQGVTMFINMMFPKCPRDATSSFKLQSKK